MQLLRRGLMAAGALALAAMLLNIVAPKAAHAIVATAVQVMNTSATPVPNRDVDAAGRHPFSLYCLGINTCRTPPVPSDSTFVVESIIAEVDGQATWVNFEVHLSGTPAPSATLPLQQLTPNQASAALNLSVYEGAGTSVVAQIDTPSPFQFALVGHLVSTAP